MLDALKDDGVSMTLTHVGGRVLGSLDQGVQVSCFECQGVDFCVANDGSKCSL